MNQTVDVPLANPFTQSIRLIAFINHTNQRMVNINVKNHGIARVIFQFTINSLILRPHMPNAISQAITWNANLYFALIHFLPEASNAVSINEKIRINTPQANSPINALF